MWNKSQIIAFGRHVVTFIAGAVTLMATFNLITHDQANMLTSSFTQIVQSLGEISVAVAPIVALISGLYASRSASPANQLKAVVANEAVAKIEIKDPVVVGAIPSDKVVMAKPEGTN